MRGAVPSLRLFNGQNATVLREHVCRIVFGVVIEVSDAQGFRSGFNGREAGSDDGFVVSGAFVNGVYGATPFRCR